MSDSSKSKGEVEWDDVSNAFQKFNHLSRELSESPKVDEAIRDTLLGFHPVPALMYILRSHAEVRVEYVPELLRAAARSSTHNLSLTRDVLRVLPRGVQERSLPIEMQQILDDGVDEDAFQRLVEVAIELRLIRCVQLLHEFGRDHPDSEIRESALDLLTAIEKPGVWGYTVVEWPIVTGA